MRIILYTGKGGVGKTSIAAATAVKLAQEGRKVLIMSTDQAHSLSDSFDVMLLKEPTKIADCLYGMEIDTVVENENAWGKTKDYVKQLITLKSESSIEVEELLVFPGLDELFALLKVKQIYEGGAYDVLVVDCAPTGETMSLLKYPEMLEWWMNRLLPMKRAMVKVAGPIVEKTVKIPMPKEETFDEIESLYRQLAMLHRLLTNKEIVSLRIVTTPEKIVVKEAKRSFSFLHLFDYNVDAIIVNKIYPKESMKGYFNQWMVNQEKSLLDIKESFCDIPIFYQELMPKELRKLEQLELVANTLYHEVDVAKVLFQDKIFQIDKEDEGYYFRIKLPFVDKSEMELLQNGDEFSIAIKNEKRSFLLPNYLMNKKIKKANYDQGRLNILFV